MPQRRIAFFRGINVGRAKRVAMADLRNLVGGLGYGDVRSCLNSGNVLFSVSPGDRRDPAPRIEKALSSGLGVSARVTVLTAGEVAAAVRGNPFREIAVHPSRLLVMVLEDSRQRKHLAPLLAQRWDPEAIALARRVAYLSCPTRILKSRLVAAVGRALGEAGTARNMATMMRIQALTETDR